MKYNDKILENKEFNFLKDFFQNLVYSIGFLILICVIMIFVFRYKVYTVESNSQQPVFSDRDMVLVKAQKNYYEGDIINFHYAGIMFAHRIISIVSVDGVDYYVCHGDNVESFDLTVEEVRPWQEEQAAIDSLTFSDLQNKDIYGNLQFVKKSEIDGKVIYKLSNFHIYYDFIKENILLVILMVVGLWEFINVIDFEIFYKKQFRMLG